MSFTTTRRARPLAVLTAFAALLIALALAAPARAAGPQYRGLDLQSLWSSSSNDDLDHELDLSQQAGVNTVRVDVAWSSLQTDGPGQFSQWYVDKLDRFVNGAAARGIRVIPTLWSTPCWASSAPDTLKQGCAGAWWDRDVTKYLPSDPADYGAAAKWMTARYGTKLAALEVWNEPNLPDDSFLISSDKAGDYARLLKAAYPAAKAGNADVPVIGGVLAFSDTDFLKQLYANGIKGFEDGIAVHPYNEWRDPSDLWRDQWKEYAFIPGLNALHDTMQAAGDDQPVWVTEFGWTTCNAGSGRWCVSEDQQATYTRKAYDILAGMDFVRSATLYQLRDRGTDPNDPEANFGLLNRDLSPKPAWTAFKDAMANASTSKKARASRVRLKVTRRRGTAYARGSAPPRSTVRLRIVRCATTRCRTSAAASAVGLTVKAGKDGTFSRALGSARQLVGRQVRASLVGQRAQAVVARAF